MYKDVKAREVLYRSRLRYLALQSVYTFTNHTMEHSKTGIDVLSLPNYQFNPIDTNDLN